MPISTESSSDAFTTIALLLEMEGEVYRVLLPRSAEIILLSLAVSLSKNETLDLFLQDGITIEKRVVEEDPDNATTH